MRWFWLVLAIAMAGCAANSDGADDEPVESGESQLVPLPEQRRRVEEHIADPEARRRAQEVLDAAQAQVADFRRWRAQHAQRMARIAENYDSSRADFQAAADRFDRRYRRFLRGLLELRLELRDLTTAEEWRRISVAKG